MTDETQRPEDENAARVENINPLPQFPADAAPVQSTPPTQPPASEPPADSGNGFDLDDSFEDDLPPDNKQFGERLERLGGEPAPAISPEEFARLQQSGQIHFDSRGRIRAQRREETDAGMSLRKRRAWYGGRDR